ncbi:MAG: single-stranded-DNA-specific exonuclease RecJ [Candidatus Omnitrophica bacterium]|nr:single-stranded-DNA-specific exonuclease RecJ [Candidatus Omnitrophota bacterium]MCM8831280.1 single-stranded-DNA-specific exonuclease RecJ [Candidatus Omnitrophota bacterium]
MVRRNWQIKKITDEALSLSKKFNISPITAQILLNRNVKDFQSFLYGNLSSLYPPQLLPDITKAVERINFAIKNDEKILVVGDYDVDGITSVVIFYEFAKNFSKNFSFYIPHRLNEGYGLQKKIIQQAKKNGQTLIITFDCGTNSFTEIELAKKYKIDVIVVDHHQPKENLNNQFAFINPKRKDASYPFSDLSSAAISFKLLQLLTGKTCYSNLDLVALSLVCDVVPLRGENRTLLKEGIKLLKNTERIAIKALCEISKLKQENIDTYHIGYILGPRINASGRIACAKEALDFFLTEDQKKAFDIANKFQEYNQLRRDIETKILKEAQAKIERELISDYAIVVYDDGWHPGVLGIVASRLVDKYYKPSFVFSFDEKIGRGSARSIHSLHLMEVLDKCAPLLQLYGGHKKAAGMQILKSDIGAFKEKINSLIKENLKPQDFIPVLEIDAQLDFKDITFRLIEEIKLLEPFGEDNPQPQFVTFGVYKKNILKNSKNSYSLWLTKENLTYEAVVYNEDFLDLINFADTFDIVYTIDWNSFYKVPKLIIRDLRLSDGASKS